MQHLFKFKFLFFVSVCMTFLASLTAQAVEFKGVLGLGYDVGGETLVTVVYTGGSSTDVKANEGFIVNGGLVMVTGAFETQATIGYKNGGANAKNGSISFNVLPIELMGFYRTTNLRMGLGLSYHTSPTLKVDISGSSSNGTYKFKDAMGYVVQVGWAPQQSPFSIDLRYTAVRFAPSNFVGSKSDFNGNVTGIYGSFYF